MNFLKKVDNMFDKTLTKGAQNRFLEYLIKYLLASGIFFNIIWAGIILYWIFK